MDTLSRAPNTNGKCLYPDYRYGPQPRSLDDPQLPHEGVVEPPIGVFLNGYTSLICQVARQDGDANWEATCDIR